MAEGAHPNPSRDAAPVTDTLAQPVAPSTPSHAVTVDPTDDRVLVESLKRGDPAAFERLVRLYGGRMMAVALRLLRNQTDADDAVQDAFISAFRAIGAFEGGSRLSTWLHRITVNAALMKMRKAGRLNEVHLGDLLPEYLPDGHYARAPRSFEMPPGAGMQAEETRAKVREKIDLLPDAYRTIIMLRDIDGFDTRQTAEMLGLSEPAAKVRLHRARQALRTLLESEFGA